jgi:hypothetical protein
MAMEDSRQGSEWDDDAVDESGELDDVGETESDEADRIEGGENALADEDRVDDR